MKYKNIVFLFFLCAILGGNACKSTEGSRKIKEAEKKELARQKEAQKQYEILVENHLKRQSESTIKRMEETKKRSDYYNQSKRKSFFQRIFGTKKKHKKPKKKK